MTACQHQEKIIFIHNSNSIFLSEASLKNDLIKFHFFLTVVI